MSRSPRLATTSAMLLVLPLLVSGARAQPAKEQPSVQPAALESVTSEPAPQASAPLDEGASGVEASGPVRERSAGDGAAVRVDGLAAVVGGAAPSAATISILRSDVELRARLALLASSSLRVALGPLPSGVLAASLAELIGEALIALEAKRLNLDAPGADTRAAERARLIAGAGPDAPLLLRQLGVSERELAAWIDRRARVSGFLAANLEGTLDVSTMELERLFRSEAHPYQGEPFEEARERFSQWLARERMQAAVRRWVDTLAQRTAHRVLARYP
jgi:hypothetical protein